MKANEVKEGVSGFSIDDVGRAIEFWMIKEPTNDPLTIGKRARVLSDIYGIMLFQRRASVARDTLTPAQLEAMEQALEPA